MQNKDKLWDLVDIDGLKIVIIKTDTVQVVNNFVYLAAAQDGSPCTEGLPAKVNFHWLQSQSSL